MRAKVISSPYIHTVPEVLILEVLVPPLPVEEHLEADVALVLLGRQALGRVVALAAVEGHQVAPHHAQVARDRLLAHRADVPDRRRGLLGAPAAVLRQAVVPLEGADNLVFEEENLAALLHEKEVA